MLAPHSERHIDSARGVGMSEPRHMIPLAVLAIVFLQAALQPAWSEPASPAAADRCNRAGFRVVVDVGHTPEVPGASSARGATEYDFNLRLAKVVKQQLTDAGFSRTVLMLTAGRKHRLLFERVTRANNLPADLFLSIHHDSVPDAFKETWEYEGQQHQFCDRFPGHSIFISNNNGDPKGSLQMAKLLGAQLKARGLTYTPHYTEAFMGNRRRELVDAATGVYRYDQLIVLKHTKMPAVLLEAGSIINREEEVALAGPERQALIGAAVTEAVAQFCAARAQHKPEPVAQRPALPAKQTATPAAATPQTPAVKRQ
jgi:N-acetylmuramoyl-L-alanine amidase